mgnify:CR=1 FL=1
MLAAQVMGQTCGFFATQGERLAGEPARLVQQALDAEPGDLISRDPNMEGSIIDLTRLLSAASDTERKRALGVLKEILGTGTDG